MRLKNTVSRKRLHLGGLAAWAAWDEEARGARPRAFSGGRAGSCRAPPWTDRVVSIDARYAGSCELPVIGIVTPPTAVLVRSDGYVAWVGEANQRGLSDALPNWFGPPAAA